MVSESLSDSGSTLLTARPDKLPVKTFSDSCTADSDGKIHSVIIKVELAWCGIACYSSEESVKNKGDGVALT